jgi:hypothetical protein
MAPLATIIGEATSAANLDVKSLIIGALIAVFVQQAVIRSWDWWQNRGKFSRISAAEALKKCYAPLLELFDELIAGPGSKSEVQEKMLALYREFGHSLLKEDDATAIWVASNQFATHEDFAQARKNFEKAYLKVAKLSGVSQ